MRVCQLVVVSIFSLAVSSLQSLAQGSDLVGTWTTEATILLETQGGEIVEAPREMSIVIEEVDGQLVRGYRTWMAEAANQPGYVEETPLNEAREPFIGSVTSDGKTIRLVETDDEGMMFCERMGPDEIELTYMEAAPHPVVYSAVFQRKK
jgi:hypothetical protein